jgi:sarcosine oxidase subunit gamma
MADPRWTPVTAWNGIAAPGLFGRIDGNPGVVIELGGHVGMASVLAPAAALGAHYGQALTEAPRSHVIGDLTLIWTAPGQWLATSADRNLADRLAADLAGIATVADQSDARAVVRISGPKARDVLAKGCLIDLHPRAFGPGQVAMTAFGHINVMLRQVDDGPTFEIALFRSMAGSFWHWLSASAGEYGADIRG